MYAENLRDMDTKEFDVDTGTYMEDVHANDFIGVDKDGDGLIDNVEEYLKEYEAKAEAYNAEKALKKQERQRGEAPVRQDGEAKEDAGVER